MADPDQVDLRLRVCFACAALFWICRQCDRGQRYCSWLCRMAAILEQRRQANRRYQHSLEGRQDHRDRQREYRKRCAQRRATAEKSVTDKSSAALASPGMISAWHSEDSEAAQAAARVVCTAARCFRTQPAWPRHPRNHQPPFLACLVCGRSSYFVDPFPPIPRCPRF
jgi:hypothetical protein